MGADYEAFLASQWRRGAGRSGGCAGGGAALLSAAAAGLGGAGGDPQRPPAPCSLPGLLRGARPRGSGCGGRAPRASPARPGPRPPCGSPGDPGASPPLSAPFLTFLGLESVCVCVWQGCSGRRTPSSPSTAPITPAPRTSFFQKCPNWPHGEVTQATS